MVGGRRERWCAMGADVVLRCEQLVKFYESPTGRVQAVRGVDLDFESGVTAAVVGPSGSGKSSLMRMLACLDRPTAGVVILDGIDLWRMSERARAGRERGSSRTSTNGRATISLGTSPPRCSSSGC